MRLFSSPCPEIPWAARRKPPSTEPGRTAPGCVQLTILRLVVQPQRHLGVSATRGSNRVLEFKGRTRGESRPYPARAVHGPGRSAAPGQLGRTLGRVCPHLGHSPETCGEPAERGRGHGSKRAIKGRGGRSPGSRDGKGSTCGPLARGATACRELGPRIHGPGGSFRSGPANLAGPARCEGRGLPPPEQSLVRGGRIERSSTGPRRRVAPRR